MTFIPFRHYTALFTSLLVLFANSIALAEPGQATEVELASPSVGTALSAHVQSQTVAVEVQLGTLDETEAEVGNDTALTLAEALERALASHPGFAALDKEYWALDAVAWQESRRPNPGLELEFGDFGGTVDSTGIRALATSLTYSQSIERGGKRTKREVAASLEREVVLWDVAELEHEIQADVRSAYGAAQAAQYEAQQLETYRRLVQRICDVVEMSVEAGRSARLELDRFQLELAMLDLELEIAGRNMEQAYLELAGTWGETSIAFAGVEAVEAGNEAMPSLEDLLPLLEEHPAYARYDAEYEALCALVDLENANAVPDMELFGGLTRSNEAEETVFHVGIAWDLKTHDKNLGNISSAGYMLEQVADNQAVALRELETELSALHKLAGSALFNYQAYGEKLIPAANSAMGLTEEGYRYGKFELMDVLDAQRTVLELEGEQTAALVEYYLLLADIEALLNLNLVDQGGLSTQTELTAITDNDETTALTTEEHNHE